MGLECYITRWLSANWAASMLPMLNVATVTNTKMSWLLSWEKQSSQNTNHRRIANFTVMCQTVGIAVMERGRIRNGRNQNEIRHPTTASLNTQKQKISTSFQMAAALPFKCGLVEGVLMQPNITQHVFRHVVLSEWESPQSVPIGLI